MKNVLIATIKSFNIQNANVFKKKYERQLNVKIVENTKELELVLETFNPDYIFFPHWSWILTENIISKYECIIFHTGRLPQDRGGSPIQNQILLGRYDSEVCALKAVKEVDAGPIYLRERVSLEDGTIDEILERISIIIFERLIPTIVFEEIIPQAQTGKVCAFNRRTPEESNLMEASLTSLKSIYDFIRMLDGEGYPRAFIDINENIRIELKMIQQADNKLKGTFDIYEK